MLQRTHTFKVEEKSYTLSVPTVGQMIAIDGAKITLSNGKYQQMIGIMLISTQNMLDMIDAQAILSVLCPDFMKDLKTPDQSLMNMDVVDSKQFLENVYRPQIVPWWIELNKMFQAPLEKVEDPQVTETVD